jgi:hypothetical protein
VIAVACLSNAPLMRCCPVEGEQMRYYFDIKCDGAPIRDHAGQDFSFFSGAIFHAKILASELRATHRRDENLRICVISENGEEHHEEHILRSSEASRC